MSHEITALFKSFTELVRAKYGYQGSVDGVTSAVSALQKADPEFLDPAFQEACNDLATAASYQVSVAGGEEAKDPPSLASGMAHSGENPYREVSKLDKVAGSSPSDAGGDADPAHDHTPKKPQPTTHTNVGNTGSGAQPGDVTATKSGLV